MDFNTYLVESKRTLVEKGCVLDFYHAVLGISSELGELVDIIKRHVYYGKPLDLLHIKEEIGDIFWYQAVLYRLSGFEVIPDVYRKEGLPFIYRKHLELHTNNLLGLIFDYIKLCTFPDVANNDDTFEQSLLIYLNCLYNGTVFLLEHFGFTLSDVLETNINKLKVRYPDKFNTQDALNRDLVSERVALESRGI